MPREIARKPRFIYPTIATSLSIAQVSALAELFFWRLLPQTDDQGRLTGHPKQLKALACPMRDEITEKNIPELLKELEEAELIIQYSASFEPLIQIKAWWDYQAGMRRIYPSKYPPPEGWQEDTVKGIQGYYLAPTNAPNSEQEPTNAPSVQLKVNIVNIPEVNIVNIPEPEAVIAPPTTAEKEIIKSLIKLKGWQADEEDVHWLQGLRSEFPGFTLAEFKASVDYYSGKAVPKHKGIWKNRFRNWMTKKQEFEKGGKPYSRHPPGRVPTEEELDAQEKAKGLR